MKLTLWLLTGVFLFSANHSAAAAEFDLVDRLKNCKAIVSMVTRSQCYDVAIDDYNLDSLEKKVGKEGGKWNVVTEKSPLSDKQNAYISLIGNDYYKINTGKFIRPSLVMRCAEGKMEAYTIWDTDVGSNDPVINTRIGNQPVIASRATRSADNQSTFIPDPEGTLMHMIGQNNFFVKLWISNTDPLYANFDIRGLDMAAKPLIAACAIPAAPATAPAITPAPAAPVPASAITPAPTPATPPATK